MDIIYVSIGPNCHAAQNLRDLNLRNFSFPFDWMLIDESKGIYYVNNLINNNFIDFLDDLQYNNNKKVVSKKYPYAMFFHHDLIKNNMIDNRDDDDKGDLKLMFKRRSNRFMELINDSSKNIVFLYYLSLDNYNNKNFMDKFCEDCLKFDVNKNIKSKFKLIIYVSNNDYDYEFNKIFNSKFKNIKFVKYIKNTNISKNYGDKNDFKKYIINLVKEKKKYTIKTNEQIVICFGLSRTGTSSLEIALQNLGYNTINVDPGRAQDNNYKNIYDQIINNLNAKKNFLENVDKKYNAFIMGAWGVDQLDIIYNFYPNAKYILTEREIDGWVISMKNHQLVANRPILKKKEYISYYNNWTNNILIFFKNKKNFITMNVSTGDKYGKLCFFLKKQIPNKEYPTISTNEKLKLTQEQIDY